jgi:hypothetical protein
MPPRPHSTKLRCPEGVDIDYCFETTVVANNENEAAIRIGFEYFLLRVGATVMRSEKLGLKMAGLRIF